MPFSANNFAVPPVERRSTPFSLRRRANSTIPDLSETLNNARLIGLQDESAKLLIGADSGVLKVSTVRHHPSASVKWSADTLETMVGLPCEPAPGRQGVEIKSTSN